MPPLIDPWINDVAIQLLEGDRLLVRLPPRVGKTHLAETLCAALGEAAIPIDGATLTDVTQTKFRSDLELALRSTVANHGSAQLIFDSFDRAIRLSQGARLQALLTSLTVDGDLARDIGVLFTARCSTAVTRPGAGSPLMSRVRPIDPPARRDADDELSAWFGESACLADRAGVVGAAALADQLELDDSYLADIRGAAAAEIQAGAVDSVRSTHAARSSLQGLLTPFGQTRLFRRLRDRLLESPAAIPAWPDDAAASVAKFASLVGAAPAIIWTDRYMYRDIEPLRRFLRGVTARTSCTIQLLGAAEVSDRAVSRAELARLTSVPGVEARFMTYSDYPDLHERHLYVGPGGWIIPQVHVIVGKQRVGNAVVAAVPSFGTDYPAVWSRSTKP